MVNFIQFSCDTDFTACCVDLSFSEHSASNVVCWHCVLMICMLQLYITVCVLPWTRLRDRLALPGQLSLVDCRRKSTEHDNMSTVAVVLIQYPPGSFETLTLHNFCVNGQGGRY